MPIRIRKAVLLGTWLKSQVPKRTALRILIGIQIVELGEICAHRNLIVGIQAVIHSRVELVATRLARHAYQGKLDIGHVIKPTAAGIAEAYVLAGVSDQRADVQPAVYHLAGSEVRTGRGKHTDNTRLDSSGLKYSC